MNNPDFSKAKRGPVIATPGKQKITIRLDNDLLAYFKQQAIDNEGGSYQTLINQALRNQMQAEPLSKIIQETLQQEFAGLTKILQQQRSFHTVMEENLPVVQKEQPYVKMKHQENANHSKSEENIYDLESYRQMKNADTNAIAL